MLDQGTRRVSPSSGTSGASAAFFCPGKGNAGKKAREEVRACSALDGGGLRRSRCAAGVAAPEPVALVSGVPACEPLRPEDW